MADRTSAALFAYIFNMLAKDPTDTNKKFAARVWEKTNEYDFSPYQMYCDPALVALGLARKGVDPRYPDDGPIVLYGPEKEQEK
jgi:hypothetical protein